MKLYYTKGACSIAARITMHELGLPFEYEAVNLKTKITASGKNFLEVNPKGYVPALITDQNNLLTETPVILQYLAETHSPNHLLPPHGDPKRYTVLEWLAYISSELHKTCSALYSPRVAESQKKDLFIPLLKKKLGSAETALGKNRFLAGDEFTLADAYFFIILTWSKVFRVDFSELPNISRYFAELKARPSIIASIDEER